MRNRTLEMVVALGLVVALAGSAHAAFGNAFDDATGHWMMGSDGTRLNDNNAPDTVLGASWSGEFPWGNDSNGFTYDKDGFTHIRGNGANRLFVSAGNAGEIVFNQSITCWTRVKWNGAASSMQPMKRWGGGQGWLLYIPGTQWTQGDATGLRFFVYSSSDSAEVQLSYAFAAETWYDIVGTFNHNTGDVSAYVYNPYTGAQLAVQTLSTTLSDLTTATGEEFRIVSSGTDGIYVDTESAAVWGRALSAGELQGLTNVPEPASVVVLLLGFAGAAIRRKRN